MRRYNLRKGCHDDTPPLEVMLIESWHSVTCPLRVCVKSASIYETVVSGHNTPAHSRSVHE